MKKLIIKDKKIRANIKNIEKKKNYFKINF